MALVIPYLLNTFSLFLLKVPSFMILLNLSVGIAHNKSIVTRFNVCPLDEKRPKPTNQYIHVYCVLFIERSFFFMKCLPRNLTDEQRIRLQIWSLVYFPGSNRFAIRKILIQLNLNICLYNIYDHHGIDIRERSRFCVFYWKNNIGNQISQRWVVDIRTRGVRDFNFNFFQFSLSVWIIFSSFQIAYL